MAARKVRGPGPRAAMPRKETALAVALGLIAFATVASRSLFVEGVEAGATVPGLHPTTERPLAAFDDLRQRHAADARGVSGGQVRAESSATASPESAASRSSSASGAVSARSSSGGKSSGGVPAGYVYWKTVRARVTAYDPSRRSCGRFADGKTSIGQSAWRMDGVATDPRAIPYGNYVVVPGIGAREVDDTGRAMKRSWSRYRRFHIDVRMTYPYQAERWGVKYLDVKLYRPAR